jgi:hypothetical protein
MLAQHALDEAGVEYEVVKEPLLRGRRTEIEQKTGQKELPVIEFENGSTYRADSKEMAERIRTGRLLGQANPPS